jgi:hypothetical protein
VAIDYYHKLAFGDAELAHINEAKPEEMAGVKESDLVYAQKLAMVKIRGKLAVLVGTAPEAALNATWVAATETTYPDIIPIEIQGVARIFGAAVIWRFEESFHGIEERLDERDTKPASEILRNRAAEAWEHIEKTRRLHSMDGTVVDLASYSDVASGVGIGAADTDFFPDHDTTKSHSIPAVYSTEGTYKAIDRIAGGMNF